MKILKLIGAVAVIGIGLWASTLHAQNNPSRTVDLECVDGNQGLGFYCGAGGTRGTLSIHRFELGENRNNSGFIPTDGLPHPYIELTTAGLRCQNPSNGGEQRFFGLYITLNAGAPIRIINFNPSCDPLFHHTATRLPLSVPRTDWFTEDIKIQVILEVDDGMDGPDISAPVVLEGID
jgi:hypothetical protein